MPQCVVIADDLTGGNATGVQLRQSNFTSMSILTEDALETAAHADSDCVIYPTNSRAVPPEEAYRRVYNATRKLMSPDVKVYSKRVDSTLRGNLGAETDAMLDALDDGRTALVVPTFPSSGRTVVGGYLLVNGMLLHKTDIAIDPKCPVNVSGVREIMEKQTKYRVGCVTVDDLMHGKHKLAETMRRHVGNGERILCFDAVTQEDLDLIADATLTSKLRVVAVDSGAFTGALARKALVPAVHYKTPRILVVVGSVHPLTARQVEQLRLRERMVDENVHTSEFLESPERREKEISRVVDSIVTRYDLFPVNLVAGDGLDPEKRIDFPFYMNKLGLDVDGVSEIINQAFAEIAARIFAKVKVFRRHHRRRMRKGRRPGHQPSGRGAAPRCLRPHYGRKHGRLPHRHQGRQPGWSRRARRVRQLSEKTSLCIRSRKYEQESAYRSSHGRSRRRGTGNHGQNPVFGRGPRVR